MPVDGWHEFASYDATVLAFWRLIGAALAACIWLVARKVVNRAR